MGKQICKKPEFWISAIGLLCLGTLFGVWYHGKPDISLPAFLSALTSTVLFAVVCLRFVPDWMRFWGKDTAPEPLDSVALPGDTPKHIELKIFVSLLAVNAVVILLVHCLRILLGHQESFLDGLAFWTCTDSQHYLDIAKDWYLSDGDWDRLVQLVFLPGYPIVVHLLNHLVNNYLYAGLIVSSLSFAGAGCVLYRLLRLDFPHKDAIRTLKYLCILPGGFFFTAPMSESLFLLLCAACMYFARTGRWAVGCLFGGLAAFTRSLGLTLFVPLFFELIASMRSSGASAQRDKPAHWWLRFVLLLLIPAGFAAYCYINYRVSGNPFQFMVYQRKHWGQHTGMFFNTASYQMGMAISCYGQKNQELLGLWLPNLMSCFGSLVIMIFAGRKMRTSYTAWFLAYFAIAIGATWLLSAPRYLIALIPVPLAVSILTKKRALNMLATLVCVLSYACYLYAFVARWQVW